MKSFQEGIYVIINGGKDELIALIRKDPNSKKVVIYKVLEASAEDISRLINNNKEEI